MAQNMGLQSYNKRNTMDGMIVLVF